ncbi:hypothetical protein PAMP_006120 [Pampus punctatissimus]
MSQNSNEHCWRMSLMYPDMLTVNEGGGGSEGQEGKIRGGGGGGGGEHSGDGFQGAAAYEGEQHVHHCTQPKLMPSLNT